VEAVVAGHGDRVPDGHAAGGRAEVPTFLSYGIDKRLSKHPEFGHRAIDGVVGPEAPNNAAFDGGLVPLLTLGLRRRPRRRSCSRRSSSTASSRIRRYLRPRRHCCGR